LDFDLVILEHLEFKVVSRYCYEELMEWLHILVPRHKYWGWSGGGLLCRYLRFFHTLIDQYGKFVGVGWGWLVQPVVIECGLFGSSHLFFGDISWTFFVFHFGPWGFIL
jgi:hypothetical protein